MGERRAGIVARPWMRILCVVLASCVSTGPGAAQSAEQTFESEGLRLHYTRTGQGRPVVFIAGGPGMEVEYLRPLAVLLPPSYSAVLLQQRGTGRSRPETMTADTVSLQKSVSDIEALRVQLQEQRLTVLGHSWGGLVAMAYAAAYPSRIERLILLDSISPVPADWGGMLGRMVARLEPTDRDRLDAIVRQIDGAPKPDLAQLELMRAAIPGYFADRASGERFYASQSNDLMHVDAYDLLMADFDRRPDLRPALRRMRRPTLVLQGREDFVGKIGEQLHALFRDSTLSYVEGAGHFPWVERPDEVKRALAAFLK